MSINNVVGLTGGIGSGKTTVSKLFEALAIPVIDADIISREVVAPNQPALIKIIEHFGSDVKQADGSLDRSYLRQLIFSNPEEKVWLENLLHPIIRSNITDQLQNAKAESNYCILSSPLLFETKQDQLTSLIIVVDLPEQLQIERACIRDSSQHGLIQKIINSQASREERLKAADFVIENSGSLDQLSSQIAHIHKQLLKNFDT